MQCGSTQLPQMEDTVCKRTHTGDTDKAIQKSDAPTAWAPRYTRNSQLQWNGSQRDTTSPALHRSILAEFRTLSRLHDSPEISAGLTQTELVA